MFQSFLRNAFSGLVVVLVSSTVVAQGDFSPRPTGQGFSAKQTYNGKAARPRPLHSLPTPPAPPAPGFSTTKNDSVFGGSNFAAPLQSRSAPKPAVKPKTVAPKFEHRKTTAVSPALSKLAPDGGRSSLSAGSSSRTRELSIDNCNVKLMEDIMIPAEEEGLLSELDVKEGDAIAAGKVIGTVDADRLEIEAERARVKLSIQRDKAADKSAVNVAIKKYRLAKEEYDVALRLGRKGSRSAHEVRRAKYSMEAAYAEVKVAQNQLKEAEGLARLEEINLKQIRFIISKMRIATPFDGHVLEILKHPQEYVQKGENVIRFARMDRLWVEATVSSETCNPTDIIGQRVTVVLNQAGGNEVEFEGRVVSVPLKMEGIGKRFRVRAEVANRFEKGLWLLRPGASLRMTVELGSNTAKRGNIPVKR